MLTKQKIIHIHPTRFCNLSCAHCYSTSGPRLRDELSVDDILRATYRLRAFGYVWASLSGGEPTLHSEFAELCKGLSRQGYKVSVITNGWNIKNLLHSVAESAVDFCAVSFDGPEELHDKIRGRKGAFRAAMAGLSALKRRRLTVGAIISATRLSMPNLPTLTEKLAAAGASRIQFHPIAAVGRAKETAWSGLNELDDEALVRLIMMTRALEYAWPHVTFQCDATVSSNIDFKQQLEATGQLITPLVLSEQGDLLPYAYGIHRKFRLGTIHQSTIDPFVTKPLGELLKLAADRCKQGLATSYYSELCAASYRRCCVTRA
ncbi:radical SAM protein [Ruegeria hyattellae]|uniref:radical SAM protein n=1 Tax=Ruegeria hyattellae TaxID=3233337 RepID=UPI00355AD425